LDFGCRKVLDASICFASAWELHVIKELLWIASILASEAMDFETRFPNAMKVTALKYLSC